MALTDDERQALQAQIVQLIADHAAVDEVVAALHKLDGSEPRPHTPEELAVMEAERVANDARRDEVLAEIAAREGNI